MTYITQSEQGNRVDSILPWCATCNLRFSALSKICSESRYLHSCRVIAGRNRHGAPKDHVTWRHTQNRKYTTYHTAVREGLSHGHRQHAQNIYEVRPSGFELREQTDRQTDILIIIRSQLN